MMIYFLANVFYTSIKIYGLAPVLIFEGILWIFVTICKSDIMLSYKATLGIKDLIHAMHFKVDANVLAQEENTVLTVKLSDQYAFCPQF